MTLPTPYYDRDGITLYHGDAAEILPDLPACELAITDPPYGVDYTGGHFHSEKPNVDFKRDRLAGDTADVYRWAIPLLFDRVAGPVYVFFAAARGWPLYRAVGAAGGIISAVIVWHKRNATYAAMRSQYKQRHEMIMYCRAQHARTRWVGPSTESTVWEMDRDPENVFHPTQKPTWLLGRAIRNHEPGLVVDPFAGSGSTLVAARLAGRPAIGIEINEAYCKVAVERLRQNVIDFDAAGDRPEPDEPGDGLAADQVAADADD